MGWIWLIIANIVLFGLVRYVARSREAKAHSGKVNWDGYDAVLVTAGIYLISQMLAGFILVFALLLQGAGGDLNEQLQTSTTTQFFYILCVEVLTLGSLQYLLKMRGNGLKMLGLKKPNGKDLLYTLIGLGMYLPLLYVSLQLAEVVFPSINMDQKQQIGFETAQGNWNLFLVFLSLVVLPAVTEEILARGFLYLGLKKHLKRIWAILITSGIFAVAHLQLGSGAPPLWTAAIDTFVLSGVLIFIRDKTGKLWAPIGLHFIKNYLTFLALFVLKV